MHLICPACHTKNTSAEFCVQCGSDLEVHRLLCKVKEDSLMNKEVEQSPSPSPASPFDLSLFFQVIPSLVLLFCTVYGIFVGMRFLNFIDRTESQRVAFTSKFSETGLEQLKNMNNIMKQEFDLILDQRKENQILQAKIQELTTSKNNIETVGKK